MKTLAILILAHRNAKQVKRLVESLHHEDIDIYIHCDKKWDTGYNELKEIESESIFVTDKRLSTNIDIWTLAQAPIHMFSNITKKYKYYALISGADYPLIPPEKMLAELNEAYPKPFIDCTPYDKTNWVYHKFSSYGLYRKYNKFINRHFKKSPYRKFLKAPVLYLTRYTLDKLHNPKQDLDKLGVKLYGGSAWWILPDKIMEYILEEYNKSDEYIEVLKKTFTPEETFYQIMAMRSPLAELVDVNPIDKVSQNCKTYAYFSSDTKPFKGHPYEFTIDDFDLLAEKSKDCYFARKFDIDIDSKILDKIDEQLLGGI